MHPCTGIGRCYCNTGIPILEYRTVHGTRTRVHSSTRVHSVPLEYGCQLRLGYSGTVPGSYGHIDILQYWYRSPWGATIQIFLNGMWDGYHAWVGKDAVVGLCEINGTGYVVAIHPVPGTRVPGSTVVSTCRTRVLVH